MILEDKVIKTEYVEWKKLIRLQPKGFKKENPANMQKLVNSLCANGLQMAFYVWENAGRIYVIDGHTRLDALELMESGEVVSENDVSVEVPEKFVCTFLKFSSEKEAKKSILIFNSRYKEIDKEMLFDFSMDLGLDKLSKEIVLPGMDIFNFSGDQYIPNYSPDMSYSSVKESDVTEAQKILDKIGTDKRTATQVCCPDCFSKFEVTF